MVLLKGVVVVTVLERNMLIYGRSDEKGEGIVRGKEIWGTGGERRDERHVLSNPGEGAENGNDDHDARDDAGG